MAYRDDKESLAARVEQLESELESARAEITRLRGGHLAAGHTHPMFGAPTRLRFERELPGALPEEADEVLVGILRDVFGEVGRLDRVGRTLAWTSSGADGRMVEVSFESRGEASVLRVTERLGGLAGGLFGGVVGGAGGGGLGGIIPLTILFAPDPLVAPLLGAAWMLAVYGTTRWGYKRIVTRRERQLATLTERLEAAARQAMEERASAPRVRVADQAAVDEDELDATAEAPDRKRARG